MVKLVEFTDHKDNQKFNYDVVDDISVFMRNDPMFYRKQFYPAIARMADMHRAGKPLTQSDCLGEMVERALEAYCKKYKIASMPDEVFTNEDRSNIINKIFSEEMEQIKMGEYK